MYNRPRIIPCLLLKEQGLVKTIQFSSPNYLGDPINAVRIFNEKEVDELCVLDIEASKNKQSPDFEFLKNIANEAFMPLSYGGGISSLEEIKHIFHIGFEKVVLNTAFIENPELIREAVKYAGSQSVVVSIDAKKKMIHGYLCYTKDGTIKLNMEPHILAQTAEKMGAGELLINSIDRDGTIRGYDLELIKNITKSVNIPVVACGGAGTLDDLKRVLNEGKAHAAAAGSMFVYYGRKKAVLINMPSEKDFYDKGIFCDE